MPQAMHVTRVRSQVCVEFTCITQEWPNPTEVFPFNLVRMYSRGGLHPQLPSVDFCCHQGQRNALGNEIQGQHLTQCISIWCNYSLGQAVWLKFLWNNFSAIYCRADEIKWRQADQNDIGLFWGVCSTLIIPFPHLVKISLGYLHLLLSPHTNFAISATGWLISNNFRD